MMRTTLGSDPEVFLVNAQSKEFVPVCGKIGGTKDKPLAMDGLSSGFCVQEDNVMLEFNIPASVGQASFVLNMELALAHVWDLVHTRLGCGLATTCSALFPIRSLQDKGARMFGCSSDFDGYNVGAKYPVINRDVLKDGMGEWRFAGGHIHLGYMKNDIPPFVVAQFADLSLGLPSVAHDKQGKRREIYGKAGRYRPTKYGIEYRTLSNFWLFEPGLLRDIAIRAENLGSYISETPKKEIQRHHSQIPWEDVRIAIETENTRAAADILAFASHILKGAL